MKKRINRKFLLVAVGLLSPLFTVQWSMVNVQWSTVNAQRKWSLDECVQYAIDHNINIQQRAVDLQLKQNDLNTARNDWMPTLSAVGAQRFSFGNAYASTGSMPSSPDSYSADLSYTNATVELDMPIFDGFRRINKKRAAHWSVEQATANLATARKNLSIQIATYYLQVLYEKGMMEVAQSQVETSRQLCDKTRKLVDDGKNPQSDLADAEAELATNEYDLTVARGRYQMALLTLSQLLNLETVEGFDVQDIADEQLINAAIHNPTQLYADIVEAYPSIVAGKAEVEKSKFDIATARAGYYPTVDFKASLNSYYLNLFHQSHDKGLFGQLWNNKSEVVGLHFNVPIFNHFQTRDNIRKAKMQLLNSQLALDDSRQRLRKDIDQAYYDALNARDKYLSAQKSQEASQLSYRYESDKYEAGRSTSYDLTQATQRLRKAQENAVQAKYEFIIRQMVLDIYAK